MDSVSILKLCWRKKYKSPKVIHWFVYTKFNTRLINDWWYTWNKLVCDIMQNRLHFSVNIAGYLISRNLLVSLQHRIKENLCNGLCADSRAQREKRMNWQMDRHDLLMTYSFLFRKTLPNFPVIKNWSKC